MNKNVEMSTDYEKYSTFQRDAINNVMEIFRNCIIQIYNDNPERLLNTSLPFTIGDLGCASGGNSIGIFNILIKEIREINPALPISIYLNDLPHIDFSVAMNNVYNGLKSHENIFIYSIGKSFNDSLFPRESMDFIFSTTSVHWMEKAPAPSEYTFYPLHKEALDCQNGKIWEKAANEEWKRFLIERQNELRKNGRLLVTTIGCVYEPDNLQRKIDVYEKNQKKALLNHLESRGIFDKLSLEEINQLLTIPGARRSEKHFIEIFNEETFSNLKIEIFGRNDRKLTNFNDTAENLSKYFANQFRIVYHQFFKNSLAIKIGNEEAKNLIDEFYSESFPKFILENYEGYRSTDTLIGWLLVAKKY